LGDVDGAIESYRTASELDDNDPFALVNLGDALVRRDRLRDAERAYLAALRIQGEISTVLTAMLI
jgi:Flp pilus assembly protein TadD